MIKINLALMKTSAIAAEGGGATAGLSSLLERFGIRSGGGGGAAPSFDLGMLKELPLKQLAFMIAVAYGGGYALDQYKEGELAKWDSAINDVKAKQASLKKNLDATKSYDKLKSQLDEDEKTIRSKIETIQTLVADRQTPPKIMLALSSAMPEEVWLSDFELSKTDVNLRGFSQNFNQVSDFIGRLKESAYFKEPQLKNTQQAKDDVGQDAADFTIVAKRWGRIE